MHLTGNANSSYSLRHKCVIKYDYDCDGAIDVKSTPLHIVNVAAQFMLSSTDLLLHWSNAIFYIKVHNC